MPTPGPNWSSAPISGGIGSSRILVPPLYYSPSWAPDWGQCFAFHGYLPQDEQECQKAINRLENASKTHDQTQIVIETPYRNQRLYDYLVKTLRPETRLCVAMALTTPEEQLQTRTVGDWRKQPHTPLKNVQRYFYSSNNNLLARLHKPV